MITPSLPQDRAALIDKDFRVTLPYRRWMSDLTKALLELQAGSSPTDPGPTIPVPQTFTIGGTGWISVTGSLESGHFNVTQRSGLTTDDLPEGTGNLYFPEAPIDGTGYVRKDGAWVAESGGGGISDGDKGDITVSVSGSVWTVDNKAITYAKLQDISATQRVLGRNTAGAGSAEEVTLSQLLDWVGSAANGDILYRTGGAWSRLAVGSTGNVLTVTGGAPAWAAPAGLANWTEGLNSSTPNGTIPVSTFTATNAATNVDAAIIPKGTGAIVAQIPDNTTTGGNKRGARANDFQRSRTNANQVASGADSAAFGLNNRVNGIAAAAFGDGNLADGKSSFCTGTGGNTRQIENARTVACSSNRQAFELALYADTTNATPTVLRSNSSVASATNQYAMSSNRAGMVRVRVVARQTAGSGTGDCAGWDTLVLLKVIAGTGSIVGTPVVTQVYGDAGASAWSIALTADPTLDCLVITVTGEASKTIQWTAYVLGPEA